MRESVNTQSNFSCPPMRVCEISAGSHSCPTTDLVDLQPRFGQVAHSEALHHSLSRETVNPLAMDRKGQRRQEGAPVAIASNFKASLPNHHKLLSAGPQYLRSAANIGG